MSGEFNHVLFFDIRARTSIATCNDFARASGSKLGASTPNSTTCSNTYRKKKKKDVAVEYAHGIEMFCL